ncbi:MAG: gamma-glutamylcysteine synthetase, partial [Bifidobacterium mongoliense]|nr:gamma-glutamylcysteine synthetase [Bifidobacterium mongoliense]
DAQFERLTSFLDGVSEEDVAAMKQDLQSRGADSTPFGRPWDFWRDFLGLHGLQRRAAPGDPHHSDVFQH